MRLLLTGSSGWLGRFLAPMLRAAGHEVVGLDVAPGADTAVIGTVADRALIDRVFASRIKKTIRFAEAPVKGMSVLKYDPDGMAAQSYRDLATEVLANGQR